jgi:hypothetical protein
MIPIIINDSIRLKDKLDFIEVKAIVPEKNIQNMLDATNARLLSKRLTAVSYNHNAGNLYECVIKAQIRKVIPYLSTGDVHNAEGREAYLSLTDSRSLAVTKPLENKIRGLYTFGHCGTYNFPHTTTYYYKTGKQIQLNNNEYNDYGSRRYVKNGKKWASNKKY